MWMYLGSRIIRQWAVHHWTNQMEAIHHWLNEYVLLCDMLCKPSMECFVLHQSPLMFAQFSSVWHTLHTLESLYYIHICITIMCPNLSQWSLPSVAFETVSVMHINSLGDSNELSSVIAFFVCLLWWWWWCVWWWSVWWWSHELPGDKMSCGELVMNCLVILLMNCLVMNCLMMNCLWWTVWWWTIWWWIFSPGYQS